MSQVYTSIIKPVIYKNINLFICLLINYFFTFYLFFLLFIYLFTLYVFI